MQCAQLPEEVKAVRRQRVADQLAVAFPDLLTANEITHHEEVKIAASLVIAKSGATHYLCLCPTTWMSTENGVHNVDNDANSSSILELRQENLQRGC